MANKKKIDPLTLRILIEIVAMVVIAVVLVVCIANVWAGIGEGGTGETEPPKSGEQGETNGTTPEDTEPLDTSPEGIMERFMADNGLTLEDYPQFVVDAYKTNAYFYGEDFEAEDFYLNYPFLHDITHEIDISDVDRSNGVPLFLQWDERWGYTEYGVSMCGVGGCGPTSLAMVAYYLTGDTKYTPAYMLQFAKDNKHVIPTGGTDWSLFGTGAVELGFKVEQLPNVEKTVAKRLQAGIPVVVNVKEGTFTTGGHYMVLVGYEDGKFRINDPNSPIFSSRLWDWSVIEADAKNFWAISNP